MEHNSAIRTYMAIMAERDAAIRERNMALDERRRAFAERDMAMLQRDAAIAERNSAIDERDKALHALQVGENTMYENDISHNYPIPQLAEPGYDPSQIPTSNPSQSREIKSRKVEQANESKGASTTKRSTKSSKMPKQGSEGLSQVTVGTSKVWGSDAVNMMM